MIFSLNFAGPVGMGCAVPPQILFPLQARPRERREKVRSIAKHQLNGLEKSNVRDFWEKDFRRAFTHPSRHPQNSSK